MHYYQFNIGDFIKDSAHLSLEEEAIYRRLIDHYYTTEKPISLDVNVVARAIRARDNCETIDLILNEFFIKTEKGFKQKRIDKELKKFKEKSKKAQKSAQARWGKHSKETQNNANAMRTHSDSDANHKPITNNHKPLKDIAPPAFNFSKALLELGVEKNTLATWLDIRKKKKAVNSEIAFNGVVKQIGLTGLKPQECIFIACENSWSGFKAEWANNLKNKHSTPKVADDNFIEKHTNTNWAN